MSDKIVKDDGVPVGMTEGVKLPTAQSLVKRVRIRLMVAIPALVVLAVLTPFAVLYLTTEQDAASASASLEASRLLWRNILISLCAGLGVSVCLGIGLSRTIVKPLRMLESLGRAVAAGEPVDMRNVRSFEAVARHGSEIGVIGMSFAESLMQMSHAVRDSSRLLIDKLAIGILVLNNDRTIRAINSNAARMLGCSDEETSAINLRENAQNKLPRGNELYRLIDELESRGLEEANKIIQLSFPPDKIPPAAETGLAPEVESPQRIHVRLTALGDAGAGGHHWMISLTDLHRQDWLLKQIVQDETITLLSTFVRGMTHEIKTPLMTIRLRNQLLNEDIKALVKESPELEQVLEDHLKVIDAETMRLEMLMKDVRDYAVTYRETEKAGDAAAIFDVVTLATEVAEQTRTLAGSIAPEDGSGADETEQFKIKPKIVLRTEIDRLECAGSVALMRHALTNLMTNAVRYAGPTGTVTLVVKRDEAAGELPSVIYVENTGNPIDKETAARLFEPFFITSTHGTGLGLSIAMQIIRAHRGMITQENIPGGVRFTIFLPEVIGLPR